MILTLVADLLTITSAVLLSRYLLHLSTPAKDWQEVQHVYRHVRSSVDFAVLKLHLPNRLFSFLRLDRLMQLRMKIYLANGGYADDI